MGNEMGNNNTSTAIKEEDNINEAEEKTLLEGTNELTMGTPQNVHVDSVKGESASGDGATEPGKDTQQEDSHAEDAKGEVQPISIDEGENAQQRAICFDSSNNTTSMLENDSLGGDTQASSSASEVNGENQMHQTAEADDVQEEATEHGIITLQKDSSMDDGKEEIPMIPTTEGKDFQQEATGITLNDITGMLENDSFDGDTHASNVNMENQMHPTAEAEHDEEIDMGLASDDTTELGKVTLHGDIHVDDVKEKIQMILAADAKDAPEKASGLISNNTTSLVENNSLEEDIHESDVNNENQVHPNAEDEDFQERATGLASDNAIISSLEKDVPKVDTLAYDVNIDHQKHPTNARFGFDDETSEPQDKPQQDTQNGSLVIPTANGTDVPGETTLLAFDDPMNLRNSFDGGEDEINQVRQPEKSPNDGSVEGDGENYGSLSCSSLEGTEEYGKQEELNSRKHLPPTYNHHPDLDHEPSIKQEAETMVVTFDTTNLSNDSELQESSRIHSDQDEPVKVLSEQSPQGTEPLQEDSVLETNSHFQKIKEGVLEKEMESQETMLCADNCGLSETSGATSDSPIIRNNSNDNLLTKVNDTTEDSQNSLFLMDKALQSDHQENCKELDEETKLSRSGSAVENSLDCDRDNCVEESLKELKPGMVSNTYDMTIGSDGDCNGERNSSAFWIATSDQVEEPELHENGLQSDVCFSNSRKALDESSAVSEQKHSVVLEAEAVFLHHTHEEREDWKNETEETKEKLEASYAMVKTSETETSAQCISDLVTIECEESFTLQNSASLSHFYSNHEGNVEQSKSCTATMFSEASSNNSSIFANGGYEKRDSITRLSTESNPDNIRNSISSHIQKSPSFKLNLRIDETDPPLYQDKSAKENSSEKSNLNMMLPSEAVLVEEKIVTMERSYSEKSKPPFIGHLKEEEEEEAGLLVMPQTQNNHEAGTKKEVTEASCCNSTNGKEKRKPKSSFFFSSCMCCTTVAN